MYHIGWFGTLWNIKNEMGVNFELNNLFANGNESKRVEEWKLGKLGLTSCKKNLDWIQKFVSRVAANSYC